MDVGRELDAEVAERVMGLRVVARDWPCGYNYDGCEREAWSWPEEPPPMHFEPWPVYVTERGTWPARRLEPIVPVSAYSTDIAAAWLVVEKLAAQGLRLSLDAFGGDPWWAEFADEKWERGAQATAPTAPEAICRAALAAMEGTP